MYPDGVDSLEGLRGLILHSHAEHVSYAFDSESGGGVNIGIVDTLYRLEEEQGIDVAERECFLREYEDEPPEKTVPHGFWVFDITMSYAPESSFYLYQAAREYGDRPQIHQMAYGRAITRAIDDGVDILNVSAGIPRPKCTHGHCAFCSQTRRAVENGITVVAAAGNNPENPIHCPANEDEAICIGGAEIECTFKMGRRPGRLVRKPPGAYWTKMWNDEDYPDGATDGTYCTMRDCLSGEATCENHKFLKAWDQNPSPAGDKPDVLAPVHYAEQVDERYPFVWAGSSFAAPVVTGCLAGVLSEAEGNIQPYEIRDALRDEASPIDSAPAGLFDAAAVSSRLQAD